MSYNYAHERVGIINTSAGRKMLKSIRKNVEGTLDNLGYCSFGDAVYVVGGDAWGMLGCLDRLIELNEIREISNPDVTGQQRMFVAVRARTFTLQDIMLSNRLGFKFNMAGLTLWLNRKGVKLQEISDAIDALPKNEGDLSDPPLALLAKEACHAEGYKNIGNAIKQAIDSITPEIREEYMQYRQARLNHMKTRDKEMDNA